VRIGFLVPAVRPGCPGPWRVVARCVGPRAPQQAKTGGTLNRRALDGEIDTIDPLKSVTIVGFQVYTPDLRGAWCRPMPRSINVEPAPRRIVGRLPGRA